MVVTPEVADQWNAEIKEGKRAPYTIMGTNEQDYLTLAQYWQGVLRYIQQLRAVVDYYRQEKEAVQLQPQLK